MRGFKHGTKYIFYLWMAPFVKAPIVLQFFLRKSTKVFFCTADQSTIINLKYGGLTIIIEFFVGILKYRIEMAAQVFSEHESLGNLHQEFETVILPQRHLNPILWQKCWLPTPLCFLISCCLYYCQLDYTKTKFLRMCSFLSLSP